MPNYPAYCLVSRLLTTAGRRSSLLGRERDPRDIGFFTFIACAFAAMNVVGGYVVTGRMLKMFRRSRTPVPAADKAAAVTGNGQVPATTAKDGQA